MPKKPLYLTLSISSDSLICGKRLFFLRLPLSFHWTFIPVSRNKCRTPYEIIVQGESNSSCGINKVEIIPIRTPPHTSQHLGKRKGALSSLGEYFPEAFLNKLSNFHVLIKRCWNEGGNVKKATRDEGS